MPPPRSTFASNVKQFVIYDTYAADFEKNQKEKDKDKKNVGNVAAKKDDKKKVDTSQELNKKYLQVNAMNRFAESKIWKFLLVSAGKYWNEW